MASTSILHIDMDAFFAAVEQLDNPDLKGRCVIVGGESGRGVVAAASYEARRFGIHSAMPVFMARQKCPHLVIVPPRRGRYSELSQRMLAILRTYSPLVEPVSIDEAFVDVGGCCRLHGVPREIAAAIKAEIKTRLQLTCSVGVAPNKFLAKIASDMNKPDGLTVIMPDRVAAFIAQLAIEKVPGVGPRAADALLALGIRNLGQVAQYPRDLLVRKLGKFGQRLLELAHGQDRSPVTPFTPAKSLSSETTLMQDTRDPEVLAGHILAQAQSVARQLRRHQVLARTITLKIKTADFKQYTRSRTLEMPVQSSEAIFETSRSLLDAFVLKMPVRLVGVGAGGLCPADKPQQAPLFPEPEDDRHHKWNRVDEAVDRISARFGGKAVGRASLNTTEDD
jgi:DNA polymerase IV